MNMDVSIFLYRAVSITPVGGAASYVPRGIMGMLVVQSVTARCVPAPYGTTGNGAHWILFTF